MELQQGVDMGGQGQVQGDLGVDGNQLADPPEGFLELLAQWMVSLQAVVLQEVLALKFATVHMQWIVVGNTPPTENLLSRLNEEKNNGLAEQHQLSGLVAAPLQEVIPSASIHVEPHGLDFL